jgi:ubiquinone/menaquinone biosynthesis C-methylase UbiE
MATDDAAARATAQKRYDRQAAFYDLVEAPWEITIYRGLRRRLWADVGGDTILEVGVGTGRNLPYHPSAARVVAIDLSPRMLRRAAGKALHEGRQVDLLLADAQRLPFRDGVFDAATATFVFCSVPDPVAGLQEVKRVLRGDGRTHLLEHVRLAYPLFGRLMDLMNPIWVRVMGANINRDTVGNVARAGIEIDSVDSRTLGLMKIIRGSVRRAEAPKAATAAVAESVPG